MFDTTMSATGRTAATSPPPIAAAPPVVDVVVPVYNEAAILDASVRRLHGYLTDEFPFSFRITVVDNGSEDATWAVATTLEAELPEVRARHLDRKGRGRALRDAWSASDATVVAYMDVDLSTGLDAFLPLVAPLVSGHSDVAIGSRLAAGAKVARAPKREFISRCYNALLRTVFASRVHDAQCGFKAVRTDVARALLPAIEDEGWFFDTELLLVAEHNGLRIHEVPVDWVDDADSRVRIVGTAVGDLKGVARMARSFLRGDTRVELQGIVRSDVTNDLGRRLVTFGAIGAMSTAISLALFLVLRDPLGAIAANALAVSATFLANTWLHARVTARRHRPRWLAAIAVYLGSLALTTAALLVVHATGGGLIAELLALFVTWSAATAVRFALQGSSR
jgi:glycosyltransferase involved in cell wall biosynthesis